MGFFEQPEGRKPMQIKRKATAGTSQSSDLMVVVEPSDTLRIEIESTVKKQYEHLIRARIQEPLARLGVTAARIRVNDRGALDYAIDARVEAALRRAAEE
jgi:citrate lyase subunit gamma (acyl carrier protein)